jgi:hypothetical protein
MTALTHARDDGQPTGIGRLEAVIETYLWLAGWNHLPPVGFAGALHRPIGV